MKKALYLYGGWPGHMPYEVAEWMVPRMQEDGFDVEETQDPGIFERDLTPYDLIVIGWTQSQTTEDLPRRAEIRLSEAVVSGTGVAGWHGMNASFRASPHFSLITGATVLDHPGGEGVPVPYSVRIVDSDHPVTDGVENFEMASEQYYMHLDRDVQVLAEATFSGEHWPWIDGVVMPTAYVRTWGEGRVFYATPGHLPHELEIPSVERLIRQGMRWAAR